MIHETVYFTPDGRVNMKTYIHETTQNGEPLFIWHNSDDKYVPVINALLMAGAMERHGLPFELHIFQSGEHGMSVNNLLSNPTGEGMDDSVGHWVPLCAAWLRKM